MTTYAGNNDGTTIEGATGTSIYVNSMWGVTVDTAGRVYYSEFGGCRVRVLAPGTRAVTTIAGTYGSCGYSGDGGLATSAQLNPRGIYLETVSNMLYIADSGNNVIRAVNLSTSIISTVAGNTTCGQPSNNMAATASRLCVPYDVWVSTSGDMYFPDHSYCLIRTVAASTGIMQTIAGTGTCGSGTNGIAAISSALFFPYSIAGDSLGNIYFGQDGSTGVRRVSASGIISLVVGGGTGTAMSGTNIPASTVRITFPYGLEVDKDGNLLVADGLTRVVWRVFAPASATVTVTALVGVPYANAPATSVYLGTVYGLWANSAGTMYVGDYSSHYVYVVTSEGDFVSVFAGTGTCEYRGDNAAASSAGLCNPWGLAGDSSANVYIADQGNCRVRRVTAATQMISTILGTASCSCANPSFTGAAS
eukprot:gene28610-34538_t